MKRDKTFYVTTPIYYPSDNLHIGHAYCSTATDSVARFKRMQGYDVMFLTGTDEHGQKIELAAEKAGLTPQQFVDTIVSNIYDLWELMDISYDDFIRTTEKRHKVCAQYIFQKLYDQGDIYKSVYEGLYCVPCESFWTEHQLIDGMCPDCGRGVEEAKEESYFFKLSKYADRLIEHINTHPEFIQPVSRKNEMMNNFLLPGLEDLAVSRTTFSWGVPVPFDPEHVIYVWLDALVNYISALGFGSEDDTLYQKYWPADVHFVGKEITRFHTIIWPIVLMALDLPLPKQIFGHGWLTFEGDKMSKSKGNIVDPVQLCDRYGVDAVRYFLLRSTPFGSDGVYSTKALIERINTDLANDYGNLVSRTVAMIEQYFEGVLPKRSTLEPVDIELMDSAKDCAALYVEHMERFKFSDALAALFSHVAHCNKYIDVTMPWVLAKEEDKQERLGTVLYLLAESIRIITILLSPIMTRLPEKVFAQLGIEEDSLTTYDSAFTFGLLKAGTKVKKGDALFPRIDLEKELEELEQQKEKTEDNKEEAEKMAPISYEEFMKMELRTAKVEVCEPLEGADKLLLFKLDVGGEKRQIISGIRKWYQDPQALVGQNVIIVANLEPIKIRGALSEGMILSAADDEDINLSLITTLSDMETGLRVR